MIKRWQHYDWLLKIKFLAKIAKKKNRKEKKE